MEGSKFEKGLEELLELGKDGRRDGKREGLLEVRKKRPADGRNKRWMEAGRKRGRNCRK